MTVLETKNLTMRFGGVTAVNDLSMRVEEGKIVALIGPNGAGKTTAFNMITGVYKPTEGSVSLASKSGEVRDITGARPDKIAAMGMARTFQNIRLFKGMDVLDNVLIGQHMHIKKNLFTAMTYWPFYCKEEKKARGRAMELLERVGLADHAHDDASSLPYGLQRRLEIARALATEPHVILLDEPAAGMNPRETVDLADFVREIREEFGLTVFLIEHHMQMVMDISDMIYVLSFGENIASGTPSEIQNNPKVIEAYLGVDEDA